MRAGRHRRGRPTGRQAPVRGFPERRRRRCHHHGRGRPRADIHERMDGDHHRPPARGDGALAARRVAVRAGKRKRRRRARRSARRRRPDVLARLGGCQAGGAGHASTPGRLGDPALDGGVASRGVAGRHPGGCAQAATGQPGRAAGRAARRHGPGVPVGAFAGAVRRGGFSGGARQARVRRPAARRRGQQHQAHHPGGAVAGGGRVRRGARRDAGGGDPDGASVSSRLSLRLFLPSHSRASLSPRREESRRSELRPRRARDASASFRARLRRSTGARRPELL